MLEWILLVAAAAGFLLLSTYRLEAPGLYADEVLFGPAALQALGECEVQASVSYALGDCAPVYLAPAYLGAAKAWLYAPVFALVDPSPISVRLPAILGSLLGLGLALAWLRRELGTAFAVIVVVVLALDPVYVLHSRFDWGPFVLSNLCKLGLLLVLARWREGGSPRTLALAFALALAGLYDKLNFIWIIVAVGGAMLACWPRAMWSQLRATPRANIWIVGGFAALLLLAALAFVLPAMRLDIGALSVRLDLPLQARKLVVYYNETYASTFARNWITTEPVDTPAWPFRFLLGQFAATLLLAAARPWRNPELSRAWNLLAFVSLVMALLLTQMVWTRQLGGSHHLVALWPLPTVQLALVAWIGAQRFAGRARRARSAVVGVFLLAVFSLVAAAPRHAQLLAIWRGEFHFDGRFEPGIARLADALRGTDARTIISVDWGLHYPLVMLAAPAERAKYRDWWPVFAEPYAQDFARNEWLRQTYLVGGDSLWITFARSDDVLPWVRERIPEFLRQWGGCLRAERVVGRDDGSPLYQVWRYRPGESCPVPELG